jgi:hypothetical protein
MPGPVRDVTPIPVRDPPVMLEDRHTALQAEAITAPHYRPQEPKMIPTFFYALGVAVILGPPVGYTWRRARQLAPLAVLASAAASYLAGRLGLLHGPGTVVVLIFGFIAGGVSADALASRRWGPAQNQR